MKNGSRKCIQNGILKRRVGLALYDTLSTHTCGQRNREILNQKMGIIFVPELGRKSSAL